ncbi:MAG TPA: cobalamin-dependent protein [Thermoanaerobaculia bacterium]|nr:cobalamin-dependent protein [Thermoanaerobaculia bacterium]
MAVRSLRERTMLAEKIRHLEAPVSAEVAEEFFRRHSDWLLRHGERGRMLGLDAAIDHLRFLASAIEAGEPASFRDYAVWAMRMLRARGIEPRSVVDSFGQLGGALRERLTVDEYFLAARFLRAGCAADAGIPDDSAAAAPPTGLRLTQRRFQQALLEGHRRAAVDIALEALRAGTALVDVYVDVIQESLFEVGRLWQDNRLTVAQEHMATAIVQFVLAQLYPLLALPAPPRGNVIITGVEGELHQVGANMVADFLEANGWNVRFLGTNLPLVGIVHAVEEHGALVVGVSATMLFNVPKVRQLVDELRVGSGGGARRIVLGGSAFRSSPNLAGELGVDGVASDLRSVAALLERITTAPSAPA